MSQEQMSRGIEMIESAAEKTGLRLGSDEYKERDIYIPLFVLRGGMGIAACRSKSW